MDSGNVLAQLDERIDKLCSLGAERGLSPAEIDDCIIKSVNEKRNVKRQKRKGSTMRSRRRHFCCVAAGACATFWVVVAAVYGLATVHKPTENIVLKLVQPYVYPFLRNVRLVGLPILRRYESDVSVYYDEECLISNPFFTKPSSSCETCEFVKAIESRSYDDSRWFAENRLSPEASKLTEAFTPVCLHKLLGICRERERDLAEGVHLIDSTSPRITALASLLNLTEEESQSDPKFHLTWRTRMVGPARVLRTIFSRPHFIAYQNEVSLEKMILVDSPSAVSYSVPLGSSPHFWYVQSAGRRRLALTPRAECSSQCKSFQIDMQPGEMFYLYSEPWNLLSMPVIGEENGPTDTSVAFVGTYLLE